MLLQVQAIKRWLTFQPPDLKLPVKLLRPNSGPRCIAPIAPVRSGLGYRLQL